MPPHSLPSIAAIGMGATLVTRAIGEKLFANSGKKRYNEFEVKKDVKH